MKEKEIARLNRLKEYENKLYSDKIKYIAGIDEAGRGPLAGPVVVGCVIMPKDSFIEYVKKEISDANIISINFNDLKFVELKDYMKLSEYIEKKYKAGKHNFVCIDEIQLCDKFELTINSLHSSEKYDIYLTGSNAFLLSSDLATLFTGRVFEIKIYPFSFSEYMKYYELDDKEKAFASYVLDGGMSGSYVYRWATR